MKCPICHHEDTKVVDSRVASEGLCIRRRRQCLKCDFRFSTYEEIEILDLVIVKRDGQRETYSRDKLVKGLKRALEKRPITDDKFKKLVHSLERDLQSLRKNEISSEEVGNIVMKHLKKLDQVAYIRYASVYESFKDAKQFQEELNKLLKKRIKRNKKKSN
ncbi:MAG: transcriptional regulator NrdR [Parcubacteria group bacterium]